MEQIARENTAWIIKSLREIEEALEVYSRELTYHGQRGSNLISKVTYFCLCRIE